MEKFDFSQYNYTRNLIIFGPKGVGKSYQAQKLFDAFEGRFKYRITDGLFKKHIESNNLGLKGPKDWESGIEFFPMECMRKASLLYFDDLGVSDGSDAYIKNMTFLLDERIERNLPTIFTTNLSMTEIEKKLDERIASRLLLNTDIVVMKGEDKRKATSKVYEFSD